ncbi:MAG: ATP-grasp domain-containing protein [Acidimicrobiia bacterium]
MHATASPPTPRGNRASTKGRRIVILTERRYRSHAQPAGLARALVELGHDVAVLEPESHAFDVADSRWLTGVGMVVARGRSLPVLAALSQAEAHSVATINCRRGVALVHNKVDLAVALAAAQVPTPQTFAGAPALLAASVPTRAYPLILKPTHGDNGTGLRLVDDPDELRSLEWPEPVALAQPFIPNDGYDLKLYAIGDYLFAVRKASPLLAAPDRSPQLVPLSAELAALGRRFRVQFDLELFGVDCLVTPSGLVVIEVNDFPNYSGVPQADRTLAELVHQSVAARSPR